MLLIVGHELRNKTASFLPDIQPPPLFSVIEDKKIPSRGKKILKFPASFTFKCDVNNSHRLKLSIQSPHPFLPFLLPVVHMWWLELQQPHKSQRPWLWHLCATKLRAISMYLQTSWHVREINAVYISHFSQISVPSSHKYYLIKNMQHLSPRA